MNLQITKNIQLEIAMNNLFSSTDLSKHAFIKNSNFY